MEEGDVWIYDFKRGTSSRLTVDPNGDGTRSGRLMEQK
jgi:hypothetical protein